MSYSDKRVKQFEDDRCSFLCPIHLERCILEKFHKKSVCLCRDILECKALRQLEEVCQTIQ